MERRDHVCGSVLHVVDGNDVRFGKVGVGGVVPDVDVASCV